MIWIAVAVAILIAFALGVISGALNAKDTIGAYKSQSERLYRDNQSLMEALAKANGQHLQFTPALPDGAQMSDNVARYTSTPYWQTKQERTVQVGDRTVTLKS